MCAYLLSEINYLFVIIMDRFGSEGKTLNTKLLFEKTICQPVRNKIIKSV